LTPNQAEFHQSFHDVRVTIGGPGDWNIHLKILNLALGRESSSHVILQIGQVIRSILNAFTRIPRFSFVVEVLALMFLTPSQHLLEGSPP
jgi:hypothetical protein